MWDKIIDENLSEDEDVKRDGLFRDILWVHEIDDPGVLDAIRIVARKYVDAVENYAQFMTRKMIVYGLIVNVSSDIRPAPDGYILTIHFRIDGIRRSMAKEIISRLKRIARNMSAKLIRQRYVKNVLHGLMGRIEEVEEDGRVEGEDVEAQEQGVLGGRVHDMHQAPSSGEEDSGGEGKGPEHYAG